MATAAAACTLLIACGAAEDRDRTAADIASELDSVTDTVADSRSSADVAVPPADSIPGRTAQDTYTTPDVPQCNDDADCNDALFCNGAERCRPGFPGATPFGCIAGPPPSGFDPNPTDCDVLGPCDEETDSFPLLALSTGDACTDGIACTVEDRWTVNGTCVGSPSDSLCDDALFCNGAETCSQDIGCLPGTPPAGSDADTTDCLVPGPCDESTQTFALIPAPIGTPCADAIECTDNDACTAAGTCIGTANHQLCADGVFCNGAEECDSTEGCLAASGPPQPPTDDTPGDCVAPTLCDEATASFLEVALEDGSACDDGVECTVDDQCNGEQVCAGMADDALCDDGVFCNGAEVCQTTTGCAEGALPAAPEDTQPNDCLSYGPCSEAAQGFEYTEVSPPGTACDDGKECTQLDSCNASGECGGAPVNSICDDGVYCNGAEECDPAIGCMSGSPPVPIDDVPGPCETTFCDENSQTVLLIASEAGTMCSDGVDCTIDDVCDTAGKCNGTPNDTSCDDGMFCNGPETCTPESGCQAGTPPVGDDDAPNDCFVLICVEDSDDFVLLPATDGTPCDDEDPATSDDQCNAGVCTGTPN